MDKQVTALEGKIVKIFDTEQITPTFVKRSFVIVTDEQYPQEVQFELGQDKCPLIDKYQVDQFIKVHYNVRGRSWTNPDTKKERYFVSLNAWRIEDLQQIAEPTPLPADTNAMPPVGEDLPF